MKAAQGPYSSLGGEKKQAKWILKLVGMEGKAAGWGDPEA